MSDGTGNSVQYNCWRCSSRDVEHGGREQRSAGRLYAAMRLPPVERRLGASTWAPQWERSPGFGPAAADANRVFIGCDSAPSTMFAEAADA